MLEISTSKAFDYFIFLFVIINTIILSLDGLYSDSETIAIFSLMNTIFSLIFLIEMIIKLYGIGVKGIILNYFIF